jgi:hypothetical protein
MPSSKPGHGYGSTLRKTSLLEEECKEHWRQEWEKLPIEQINAWVDKIPKRINKILEQEGDNGFRG